MSKKEQVRRSLTEATINGLDLLNDKAPMAIFVVLIVLYLTSNYFVSRLAGTDVSVMIFGYDLPFYAFAGVFSSVANICVIFLTVYYGRVGFITSLIVLLIQTPIIMMAVVVRGVITSLPGVFGNLFCIISICVIYYNNKKLDASKKQLSIQATTDMLTGLPNTFASTKLVKKLADKGERFALVSIDLNGFKSINDTMGFDAGNKVLVEVAKRWREICESEITGTNDFVSRLSGDEFTIIIRNFRNDNSIVKTIKCYESALTESLNIDGVDFFVSASFGYAIYPDDTPDIFNAISCAVIAMHDIKHCKSSEHIRKFTKDMVKEEKVLETERKIRSALENDTIFFLLQPQFDMDHKLRGFEALARMKDDNGDIISPGEFIPVAEKVGLIDKVDSTVFKKSSDFIGNIIKDTGADITLSINVSVRHLMKNDFLDEIKGLIENSGIPASNLEIEITESIMIESMDKAMECIDKIKEMGVKIAIDDFGTGYSSLSYLHSFPANLLKIDKAFIDKMTEGESSKKYVAAIISLGHIMGFDVISEGVEEDEQLGMLREIGCDFIQGFIWGKPLPEKEAEKLIKESVNK